MGKSATFLALLVAALVVVSNATGANPKQGDAANNGVEIAAVFMDAAAVKQAVGSDFTNNYTVIEVTVTPKGGRAFDIQPDDFLLRINSDSESSGPMAASQVLGAGGGLVLHREQQQVIGIDRTTPGNTGVTTAANKGSVSNEAINTLQSKMLPAKNASTPVTGLLFFPIAKKKPRDLDLVYSTPDGKLHISFR